MKMRWGLVAVATVAIAACQSAPAPGAEAALAGEAGGPSEGPEMICRMEPVAGSRVRKQEVCSRAKFNTIAGDALQQRINNDMSDGLPADAGGG